MCRLFRSDWQPVWAYIGEWHLTNAIKYKEYSLYEIDYSPKRGKYRLKMSGYNPRYHPSYPEVVQVFNQLTEDLCEQKDFEKSQQGPEEFDFKSDPTQ